MRCRPCDQTMHSTFRPRTLDTAHACGSCGRFVVTRDPGVYPRPSAAPFRPLQEDEKGWEQPGEGVSVDLEETPRERAQRERREAEKASGLDRGATTRKAWATRSAA